MPKERVRKSGKDGWADLLVQWGDEITAQEKYQEWDERPRVRLFIIATELGPQGSFYFYPQVSDEEKRLNPDLIGANGEGIGPVDIMLDRQQINRLIRVLRRARDQAYGADQ